MWSKQKEFPAALLCVQANGEQVFSLGGRLSDPNMDPAYLATLVFVGSNLKVYMPPMKDIWQRYIRKFSKNGKLVEEDIGLAAGDAPAPTPAPASAPTPDA